MLEVKWQRPPNSDGLIKCLRQPGQIRSQPSQSMVVTFNRLLNFVNRTNPATETKSMWVGGRRAGAVFFALHLDNFIVTRNFAAIYRDLYRLDNFTVTRNLLPSTGTGKKHVTATLR